MLTLKIGCLSSAEVWIPNSPPCLLPHLPDGQWESIHKNIMKTCFFPVILTVSNLHPPKTISDLWQQGCMATLRLLWGRSWWFAIMSPAGRYYNGDNDYHHKHDNDNEYLTCWQVSSSSSWVTMMTIMIMTKKFIVFIFKKLFMQLTEDSGWDVLAVTKQSRRLNLFAPF